MVNQWSSFSITNPTLLPGPDWSGDQIQLTSNWLQHVSMFPYLFAFLTMTEEIVVMARPMVALHPFSSEKETA